MGRCRDLRATPVGEETVKWLWERQACCYFVNFACWWHARMHASFKTPRCTKIYGDALLVL